LIVENTPVHVVDFVFCIFRYGALWWFHKEVSDHTCCRAKLLFTSPFFILLVSQKYCTLSVVFLFSWMSCCSWRFFC